MLVPRVFVKNLRLTKRLIDDFLTYALGATINDSCLIPNLYFGFNGEWVGTRENNHNI